MSSLAPVPPTRRSSLTSANRRERSMVTRPAMRRAKSNDMGSDAGSSRVLIDYSKTRATHSKESNRSQCRGPQMSRQLYDPKSTSLKKNLSARDLDWKFLENTMNTSSEQGENSSHESETEKAKEETETEVPCGRFQLPRRSCSARLRMNLSRSPSGRVPTSEAPEGDEKESLTLWADEINGKVDAKGRTKVERSISLGSSSLVFRRHPVRVIADLA